MSEPTLRTSSTDAYKFGTFGGVFTPCTLTILGVIMFLRFGQVVGQAGVISALLIVLFSKAITVLTGFSLSAIATNTRVKGGGAYFLISRSLGVEYGGAIGVFFYLAMAISVAMYVIGFTEAFVSAFPNLGLSFRTVATIVNVLTFCSVYVGAGWTIKAQYGILAILIVSIVSFFAGAVPQASMEMLEANLQPSYLSGQSFFTMFALFFPAVTGIMAGANMSGDLKDPGRSIPTGTLSAIAVTGAVYVAMALLLGAVRGQEELAQRAFVVKEIAWSPMLITAGVFAATLSSALGSMMGAPRILQAFARDGIFSWLRWFARGSTKSDEPRRAILLTFLISQIGILLGDLNAVAPIITMFFMITYGTLNLACFYEGITRNPSYRPRFHLSHWSMSLLGAVGCLVVMFLMNPVWALAAVLAMGALYVLISRAEILARWGDVTSGVVFERARKALLKLEEKSYHPKNWRPAILALSGGAWSRYYLAQYAYWLGAGRGIVSLGQVISGEVEDRITRREQAEKRLRKFIHEEELRAFPVVVVDDNLGEGIKALLQCHGIGGLRPNTVLLGWSVDLEKIEAFGEALRLSKKLGRSVIIVKCEDDRERWIAPRGSINVWWKGPKNGELTLLLAHLLKQNPEWRRHPIRILCPLPLKADKENKVREMRALLDVARIDAEILVLETANPLVEIGNAMQGSAVLFADFDPPEEGEEWDFVSELGSIINQSCDVILVYNAGGVSLES